MLKPVWRSTTLRTSTKLRLFNSNVKSILLYGSETWRETASSIKTLQVFMNRCLRNILGVRWPDTISNKQLWRKTQQQTINLTIRSRRWKWIGKYKYYKTGLRMEPPRKKNGKQTKELVAQRCYLRAASHKYNMGRGKEESPKTGRGGKKLWLPYVPHGI